MTIKAIETRYKGYRFRSRLEARWAVFFDTVGVRWEYEIQTFDLGAAGWYLPDFWLPEQQCWVEIKPMQPTLVEETKAQLLAVATEQWVDLIAGGPGDQTVYGFRHYPYWQKMSLAARRVRIGLCNACGNLTFLSSCGLPGWSYIGHCYKCGGLPYIERPIYGEESYPAAIENAFEEARSANFDRDFRNR